MAAPTMEELQARAVANGWLEGVPYPVKDLTLVLSPGHPLKPFLEPLFNNRNVADRVCTDADVNETEFIRNQWRHPRVPGLVVYLVQRGPKVEAHTSRPTNAPADMLFGTMVAADAWTVEAEERALGKLRELLPEHMWVRYRLSDCFIETSKRSGVLYMFRKLRPTLACSMRGPKVRILASLCMHPLGYYAGTWAGTMTPTDDVIAHLLFMRADEHGFWKTANQHPPEAAESGLFA